MEPLPGERWSQAGPEASALAQRGRAKHRASEGQTQAQVHTLDSRLWGEDSALDPTQRGCPQGLHWLHLTAPQTCDSPFPWSSPTSSVHPQGRAQAWTPAPSLASPCPSRSAPGPWIVYLCRQVPGLQEPGLGAEKQVGPFDTVKLVTGASEKQEKQPWTPEDTHSSFFPLPFTLIKGQFSQPLPRCAFQGPRCFIYCAQLECRQPAACRPVETSSTEC